MSCDNQKTIYGFGMDPDKIHTVYDYVMADIENQNPEHAKKFLQKAIYSGLNKCCHNLNDPEIASLFFEEFVHDINNEMAQLTDMYGDHPFIMMEDKVDWNDPLCLHKHNRAFFVDVVYRQVAHRVVDDLGWSEEIFAGDE